MTPAPGQQTAGSESSDDDSPISVVVSMPFFPSMVEAVGGDRVEVRSIVPVGADPHTYQPSPGDARLIADADIIFINGFGQETWLEGLIESAGGVDAPVVELAHGLERYALGGDHHDDDHGDDHGHDDHADEHHDDEHADDHGHDNDHDHAEGNPHFWLNPVFGIHYVERIADALAERDPANAEPYRANAESYIAEIEAFDEWAHEQIATIPEQNRKLITFHDAFPYLAEHYGLEMVGVIIRSPGREPGAQEIARIADEIQRESVPAIFIEPQFNPRLADALASETGVSVQTLFSDTPPEGAGYLDMMRLNIESIVEGLGQ